MREVTLCFPIRTQRPESILLGMKKGGFGRGKYVGFGGKIQPGETIAEAAIRELAEEAGLRAEETDLQWRGELTFLFPARPTWDHLVHVFLTTTWKGSPRESNEVTPVWFPLSRIPYSRMWDDASLWLPQVLEGIKVQGRFVYGDNNQTVRESRVEHI